uniref:Protocadherin Fat 4-like n=1 Tax=Saccoglossus kowalevskii TaxID=10224 RepID=A0ABM0MBE1_SACKO|nr:PREDICTED: protocadherin Fat 4-like [Saccoglossus kowalevskii]
MATVSLNGLHHWSQWTVFTLYGIVTLCLIGGKVAQAEVCDFTHDSRTNPEDIFLSTYEERPVDETLIALDVEGTIGTSGDIKLEIDDTTYLKLDEKNITWKMQYDLDTIKVKQVTVKVDCYKLSNSFKKSINIHIDIYDINDNDPFFIGGPYVLNISELWPPGIVIFDGVEADDNDIDTSSTELIYSYEAEGFGDFVFTPKEELMIAPAGLDYETRSFYNVTLFVKDDSDNSTPRTGISYLFINVLDGDDQNPVFGSTHYSATVIEEVSGVTLDVNPPIYAYDPDFGLNETIIYSFANPQNLLDYEKLESDNFRINTTTGEITIIHAVDKENQTDDIFIRVRAAQKDQPAYRYNFILVVVSVIDVNDNAPVMGMSNYTGIITEDSPIGAFVSEFGATDNDQAFDVDSEGALTYGISDNQTFSVLNNGIILTAANLDRETQDIYTVTLTATDGNLVDTTELTITVTDANDNAPEFNATEYAFDVVEGLDNQLIGSVYVS